MAAISTILGGAALATSMAGQYMSYSSGQKQAKANERISAIQAGIISPLQQSVVDLQGQAGDIQNQDKLAQYGTEKQVISYQQQVAQRVGGLQDQGYAVSQEVDALKQRAVNLDATRRRQEMIRQGIAARSAALTVATAQGAAGQGSSGLQGAYAQIAARTGVNVQGVTQQQRLAQELFGYNKQLGQINQDILKEQRTSNLDISNMYLNQSATSAAAFGQVAGINQNISSLYKQIAAAGGDISGLYQQAAGAATTANTGAGLSSLGGTVIKNLDMFSRVGNYVAGKV
jgi:hypothetical protein